MATRGDMDDLTVALVTESLRHRVPGGTGRATATLLTGLRAREDLDVIELRARNSGVDQGPCSRAWRLPRALLYESWARTGRPRADRLAPEAHVVHSPMLPTPGRGRTPVVVTLHDLSFLEQPEAFPSRPRRMYARMWERVRDEADLVLCSSLATLASATANGLDPARARHVPLGVEVAASSHDAVRAVRAAHGLPETYVLSVGTVEPRKNLRGLLTGYARSGLADRGVGLVVVGPAGWNEQLSELLASVPQRVREQIYAVGEVQEAELSALYLGARVFCYPSLLEGFGLPVVEAMAHGTPVVTSATTSTAEVAGAAGLLIDPHDADDIGSGLRALVDDDAEHRSRSQLGRSRARDFSVEAHVAAVIDVYREVAT